MTFTWHQVMIGTDRNAGRQLLANHIAPELDQAESAGLLDGLIGSPCQGPVIQKWGTIWSGKPIMPRGGTADVRRAMCRDSG